MPRMKQRRPEASEHLAYYSRYIDLVPETDILGALEKERAQTQKLIASIDEQRGSFRYGADKWSVKQLLGHVEDSERVFTYRALTFARGGTVALPGFEQEEFMANSPFDASSVRDRAEGLDAVRRATISLFRGLDDAAWERGGTASDNHVSVRALAYITLGHERHHLKILRERYLA
jgi:DinB superfamily